MSNNPFNNLLKSKYAPLSLAVPVFFLMICNEGIANSLFMYLVLILTLGLLFQEDKGEARYAQGLFFLLAYLVYQFIMIFFANSPKFAYVEFSQLLTGLCLLLSFHQLKLSAKEMGTVLLLTSSICAFLSIDLISTRLFSNAFASITGLFSTQFTNLNGLEQGVRITSIFGNPNVFAGIVGMGVLFSLALSLETSLQREESRFFYLSCLFLNSLAFVLAFSLGASITICMGFFLYLLLEPKKIHLLLLMVETFLLSLVFSYVIYLTSFQVWTGINLIPLGSVFLGAFLLCLCHEKIGHSLGERLQIKVEGQKKFLPMVISGLLAVVFA